MSSPKTPLQCPQCHGPSIWEGNPFKPFCSDRCRMIDLGNWVSGRYAIPGEAQDASEEEKALLEKETKSSTVH